VCLSRVVAVAGSLSKALASHSDGLVLSLSYVMIGLQGGFELKASKVPNVKT